MSTKKIKTKKKKNRFKSSVVNITERMKNIWMQTHSGGRFKPLSPDINLINIEDIATSLSNTCRFNGHCKQFYSVAQHSVIVSYLVPEEFRLDALMHDSAEAYVGDIPSPIKLILGDVIKKLESGIYKQIAKKYGLSAVIPKEVKHADVKAMLWEKRDLLTVNDIDWNIDEENYHPLPDIILEPVLPYAAKKAFLERFHELMSTAESEKKAS
jgi:hypothetical protein